MRPEELSEQLREGSGEFLEKRRKIARLALLAAGSMGVISLYQLGVIRHLPDPPLPGFGSERLDASVLLMPLVGFLPAGDERMDATIRRSRPS